MIVLPANNFNNITEDVLKRYKEEEHKANILAINHNYIVYRK